MNATISRLPRRATHDDSHTRLTRVESKLSRFMLALGVNPVFDGEDVQAPQDRIWLHDRGEGRPEIIIAHLGVTYLDLVDFGQRYGLKGAYPVRLRDSVVGTHHF